MDATEEEVVWASLQTNGTAKRATLGVAPRPPRHEAHRLEEIEEYVRADGLEVATPGDHARPSHFIPEALAGLSFMCARHALRDTAADDTQEVAEAFSAARADQQMKVRFRRGSFVNFDAKSASGLFDFVRNRGFVGLLRSDHGPRARDERSTRCIGR